MVQLVTEIQIYTVVKIIYLVIFIVFTNGHKVFIQNYNKIRIIQNENIIALPDLFEIFTNLKVSKSNERRERVRFSSLNKV